MKATPEYRPDEMVPAEGSYAAVDSSGELLSVAVRCKEGQRLPRLAVAGTCAIGYIQVGAEVAVKTAK